MLPEKHNERCGWKNKLDGLTGLPGEAALEKNVAWEKLHSRLREKPHNKKAVWYWAAACLLFALTIPLMLPNKKENIVLRNQPPQKRQTIVLPIPPVVRVTVKVFPRVEKKKMEININDQYNSDVKNTVKKEQPVTAIAETVIEKDPVAIITDTAGSVAVAIPVTKKLAVVHINELQSPSTQYYPVPNYVQRAFKIKFKNGKATNQTIASQQQYEGGFKIKLSPKN
ncbi:MAG: hypothetical protein ABIO79_12095 [Ferruginibacter sp.]